MTEADEWWRGATLYQIYPRSFMDANGDGVGDLAGVTARLDYVASLGVDGIWLSPFFTSPMADFGYDVADYCDVDRVFGTMSDFDQLVARAHALGLKVIIDQVHAHSSDQHRWFQNSRASCSGEKADWYVWADAKPDGSPPNNWQSVFLGPAWTWDARRGQYYLHNFLKEQPQLNLHNPAVQDALLDVLRFWLERGVDGFRMDAINFAMHDPALTDNPPAPPGPRSRPFDFQLHVHNQSQPQIPAYIERVRALLDHYPGRYSLAEIGGVNAAAEMKLYTAGAHRFHSAYSFDFLEAPALTPEVVREALAEWPDAPAGSLPSWAFSNHDVPRWLSRWAPPGHEDAFARMVLQLFCALPGNLILWQGEELGLTQAEIPFERLQDPEAVANWPQTKGRDGARTPMVWDGTAVYGGFSVAEPWLPLGAGHSGKAVSAQSADPGSLLNLTRELVRLRQTTPALRHGRVLSLEATNDLLRFDREADGNRLTGLWNFSASPKQLPSDLKGLVPLHTCNGATIEILPPFAGLLTLR